jgi:Type III flagellar switch regulator (C-ring) FliN C-term
VNAPEGNIKAVRNLKSIDPVEAELTNYLIRLLDHNEMKVGEQTLIIRVVAGRHMIVASSPWFVTEDGCKFQILRANATMTTLSPERLVDAVAAIDAVDPLLVHLEPRIGVSFEPDDLVARVNDDGIILTVMAESGDAVVWHMLNLVLPIELLDSERLAAEARLATPSLRDLPCLVDIRIHAAALTIEDALAIAKGDLLIMGQSKAVRLTWLDSDTERAATAVMDFATGKLTVNMIQGDDMSATTGRPVGGFAVPIAIALQPNVLTLETLGNLKPGTTVPIGALSSGLLVDLMVGGRPFAKGEIVQIGDQFAVLIETRIDMDDGAAFLSPQDAATPPPSAQTQ